MVFIHLSCLPPELLRESLEHPVDRLAAEIPTPTPDASDPRDIADIGERIRIEQDEVGHLPG